MVDGVDPVKCRRKNCGIWVVFDCSDQIQIFTGGSFVGTEACPLIADEIDALGRTQAGFYLGDQSPVGIWRVQAAVVTFGTGIREEKRGGRSLQRCGLRSENIALLSLRARLEAHRERPLLSLIGLDARAEIEAALGDGDLSICGL